MDIMPGLDPLADIRYLEVMIGTQRQFVLFTGRETALSWHHKTTDRPRPVRQSCRLAAVEESKQ